MSNAVNGTFKSMSPQLLVKDIERSIQFYTSQLNFQLEFRYDDFYAGIIYEGFSIHLKTGNPLTEERQRKKANHDLDIVFGVVDVDKLYGRMKTESVDIIQPLCVRPYGKEFYIADPDGYILAFLES